MSWLASADRLADWSRAHAVVAGLGRSGFAAADGLLELGAEVTVLDDAATDANVEKANLLDVLDADVRLGPGSSATLPDDADLVIASPGWPPTAPLLAQARARGIPVWSEVELAWRMMQPDRVVPWLAVTGTNGKTTTTNMLESMLRAAGLSTTAVGNIGRPIVEAVLDETSYDVFAVELSSFQLHWTNSLSLHSAAVLNVQPDHLEWYAEPASWDSPHPDALAAYAADKALIYERVQHSCVYNVADPVTQRMVEDAEVVEGARAIGFTLGVPGPSMLGVVDEVLVDRAFIAQRRDSAIEIAKLADVVPYAPTTSRTRWRRPRWPVRSACRRRPSGRACATWRSATTASRPWPSSTASATSTTPRPRTPTRRPPRCGRSTPSSGSPAGRPRAPASTSSSNASPTGCEPRS